MRSLSGAPAGADGLRTRVWLRFQNQRDFELSATDMTDITALDRGERTGPDPDTFNYVPE